MGSGISGFLTKFFSTDSIVSRIVRAFAIAGAYISGTGVPHSAQGWISLIAAIFAGLVPAGQNQSSPATPTAKKAVPPTA